MVPGSSSCCSRCRGRCWGTDRRPSTLRGRVPLRSAARSPEPSETAPPRQPGPADRPASDRMATADRASFGRPRSARRSGRTARRRVRTRLRRSPSRVHRSTGSWCIAGNRHTATQLPVAERARDTLGRVGGGGIQHEEPDEARGMPRHRGRDGFLIARNARDQRGPIDVLTIELGDPSIGERLGGAWRLPAEQTRHGGRVVPFRQVTPILGEDLEEPCREKMTVGIAYLHWMDFIAAADSRLRTARRTCQLPTSNFQLPMFSRSRERDRSRRKELIRYIFHPIRSSRFHWELAVGELEVDLTREFIAKPVDRENELRVAGIGSIFCRSQATWTSTVRVDGIAL